MKILDGVVFDNTKFGTIDEGSSLLSGTFKNASLLDVEFRNCTNFTKSNFNVASIGSIIFSDPDTLDFGEA